MTVAPPAEPDRTRAFQPILKERENGIMILQTLPATCGWHLFKIEGQLDFVAAPTVQTALRHAAGYDHGHILIDLEDLKIADEKGVSALASAVRRLLVEFSETRVAFIVKDEWLAETLKNAEFPAAVPVYRSSDEALGALQLKRAA